MANPSLIHRNSQRLSRAVVRFASLTVASVALISMPIYAVAQDSFDINEAERMMSVDLVDLRSQLVFGLRTNLPGQVQFIDSVIAKVESKEIPRAMVNVIFVWARKRNPKIPYPYFEVALRLLAEKRGVTFPATNSIVVAQ
ncbi:MAG: hypothetical protein MUC83_06195 [Pirellula sp.]|nr:hypothetical protein [Pirellula sp.]